MNRVSICAAVLAFCVPAAAFAANGLGPQGYASGGSSTIECDSSGNGRHRCAAPGFMGARLVRQLSHAPCTEGESWGFDQGDPAVWVAQAWPVG